MAIGIAALLAGLIPLLMAGGSAVGSYFGSRGKGSQGTPQGGPGMDALVGLGQQPGGIGQQPSVTDLPGGGQLTQYSRQNPQQQQLLSQLLEQLSGQLGQGGQGGQDPIAAQARKQFKQRGLPELLERFAGQGKTLAGSSSMRNAVLEAQTNLESQLAGKQYGMLQNLIGGALQPQQEQLYAPAQSNPLMTGLGMFGEPFLNKFGTGAAKYGLGYMGLS